MPLDVPSSVTSTQLSQTGSDLYAGLTGLAPASGAIPVWGATHRFQGASGTSNLTIVFGSDGGGNSLTDGAAKVGTLSTPHCTGTNKPIGVIHAISDGTVNTLKIGGNNASLNTACTNIDFYTAPGVVTVGGTRRGGFDRFGNFDLLSGLLVSGPLALSGVNTAASANVGGLTVPLTAAGFFVINITGGNFKVPYYNL